MGVTMSLIHRIESADQGMFKNAIKQVHFCAVWGVLYPIIGFMMTKMLAHHAQLRPELWLLRLFVVTARISVSEFVSTNLWLYNTLHGILTTKSKIFLDIVVIVEHYNIHELSWDLLTLTIP